MRPDFSSFSTRFKSSHCSLAVNFRTKINVNFTVTLYDSQFDSCNVPGALIGTHRMFYYADYGDDAAAVVNHARIDRTV